MSGVYGEAGDCRPLKRPRRIIYKKLQVVYGHIDYRSTFAQMEKHEPWKEAIAWLRDLTPETALGIAERYEGKMLLNVHSYRTNPREECRYENHQHTVDIQYTIAGGECIEWALANTLEVDGEYIAERDKQYFHVSTSSSPGMIHMLPRYFAIFMTDDAHCPKINDGSNQEVLKAVVKIDTALLQG